MSILESLRHELSIAHGFTVTTPSLHGWKAFPTTVALSPMAPQVSGVTPGPLFVHGVSGIPYGEVRDILPMAHKTQIEGMPMTRRARRAKTKVAARTQLQGRGHDVNAIKI